MKFRNVKRVIIRKKNGRKEEKKKERRIEKKIAQKKRCLIANLGTILVSSQQGLAKTDP